MSTLDDDQAAQDFWSSWKLAHQLIRAAIIADVTAVAQIPEPELSVLMQVISGPARQNAIAAATGWDRTRLSHLLTRMADRDLVTRHKLTNGTEVRITDAGTALLETARPAMTAAVRKQFADRLDADELAALDTIIGKLLDR